MKRVRLDSPHGRSVTEVLAALNVSLASGLSDQEAEQRLSVYGANAIGSRQKVGLISVLVHQFQSLVVALLAVAAAVAFYFREWEEGAAIVGVLILNAAIGFVTEIKAVRSIEAIRALGSRSARVLRGGKTRLIPAERLVPGDIVLLDAGDVISADLRVVETADLDADESTLTGESMRVGKSTAPVDAAARVADRTSMLFKGTSITRGTGAGVVVATGMDTELGHISRLVAEAETEASPLEKKLALVVGAACLAHTRPDCADRRNRAAARQGRLPDGRGRYCARRRGYSRGFADRCHARPGARHVANGAQECPGRTPVGS